MTLLVLLLFLAIAAGSASATNTYPGRVLPTSSIQEASPTILEYVLRNYEVELCHASTNGLTREKLQGFLSSVSDQIWASVFGAAILLILCILSTGLLFFGSQRFRNSKKYMTEAHRRDKIRMQEFVGKIDRLQSQEARWSSGFHKMRLMQEVNFDYQHQIERAERDKSEAVSAERCRGDRRQKRAVAQAILEQKQVHEAERFKYEVEKAKLQQEWEQKLKAKGDTLAVKDKEAASLTQSYQLEQTKFRKQYAVNLEINKEASAAERHQERRRWDLERFSLRHANNVMERQLSRAKTANAKLVSQNAGLEKLTSASSYGRYKADLNARFNATCSKHQSDITTIGIENARLYRQSIQDEHTIKKLRTNLQLSEAKVDVAYQNVDIAEKELAAAEKDVVRLKSGGTAAGITGVESGRKPSNGRSGAGRR